jgi:hypothetical protein
VLICSRETQLSSWDVHNTCSQHLFTTPVAHSVEALCNTYLCMRVVMVANSCSKASGALLLMSRPIKGRHAMIPLSTCQSKPTKSGPVSKRLNRLCRSVAKAAGWITQAFSRSARRSRVSRSRSASCCIRQSCSCLTRAVTSCIGRILAEMADNNRYRRTLDPNPLRRLLRRPPMVLKMGVSSGC